VIRYGQLYGPGTYYPDAPPPPPSVHVDAAARATVLLLDAEPGIVEVVEGGLERAQLGWGVWPGYGRTSTAGL